MKNRLTELLGIKYPIIQGAMMDISKAKLAAAVSNAGGLGIVAQSMKVEDWHEEVKKARDLTDKPFAVNLPLHVAELDKRLQVIFDEGLKIVVTAAGNPKRVMDDLKKAGITVLHVVAAVNQAQKVEAAGVDAVIAEGEESGGLASKNPVSTLVLVPKVVDAVSIPVIAAGGIGDARGLLAAFALGAQGVQIGTRFLATEESEAHEVHKQAVIQAGETETAITDLGWGRGRVIKKEGVKELMAGQISGMVDSIEPAGKIIEKMVADIAPLLEKVDSMVKG